MHERLPRRALIAAAAPLAVPDRAFARFDREANEAIVRRFYEEVLAFDGDLNAIDELLAPDFTPQDPDDIAGPDAYKQRRVDQRDNLDELFTEWRFLVDDLMAVGDRVAVRGTVEGTRRYVDTAVRADHFGWFVIQNGRIVNFWSQVDAVALTALPSTDP